MGVIQEVGLITGSPSHRHKVENKNSLYKAINYLNSIQFEINNLLLNYLNNEDQFLLKVDEGNNSLDYLQILITLKLAQ